MVELGRNAPSSRQRPGRARAVGYRGYDIVPKWQWSSWCTGIYPTRADLPILSRSILSTMAPEKEEAVAEAKHCIDRILSRLV